MATVPPAFIVSRDLPEDPKVDNNELCVAIAKVVGRAELLGAQRIGALWRVYLNTSEARANLLGQGLAVRGITVAVASQNPFFGQKTRWYSDPRNATNGVRYSAIHRQRHYRSSFNKEIKKGVKLRSALKLEEIRDREGKLTGWLSGRRFVFIDLPKTPLEKNMDIGPIRLNCFI